MAAVKRLLLYPPAHCPQKSKNATLWVHLHQCPIASHHIPPQSAAAILTAAFPSTDPRRQQKYRLISSRNLKKRAPEIFSQAPLLFMSYYNTLFLLCQLFSLFFICSYFVLFFRFFFYRFLVVIPWLLFFGFYSLTFVPLLYSLAFISYILGQSAYKRRLYGALSTSPVPDNPRQTSPPLPSSSPAAQAVCRNNLSPSLRSHLRRPYPPSPFRTPHKRRLNAGLSCA